MWQRHAHHRAKDKTDLYTQQDNDCITRCITVSETDDAVNKRGVAAYVDPTLTSVSVARDKSDTPRKDRADVRTLKIPDNPNISENVCTLETGKLVLYRGHSTEYHKA